MVTTCRDCQCSYAANRAECPKCGTKNPFALAMERKLEANEEKGGREDESLDRGAEGEVVSPQLRQPIE